MTTEEQIAQINDEFAQKQIALDQKYADAPELRLHDFGLSGPPADLAPEIMARHRQRMAVINNPHHPSHRHMAERAELERQRLRAVGRAERRALMIGLARQHWQDRYDYYLRIFGYDRAAQEFGPTPEEFAAAARRSPGLTPIEVARAWYAAKFGWAAALNRYPEENVPPAWLQRAWIERVGLDPFAAFRQPYHGQRSPYAGLFAFFIASDPLGQDDTFGGGRGQRLPNEAPSWL